VYKRGLHEEFGRLWSERDSRLHGFLQRLFTPIQ